MNKLNAFVKRWNSIKSSDILPLMEVKTQTIVSFKKITLPFLKRNGKRYLRYLLHIYLRLRLRPINNQLPTTWIAGLT